MSFNVHMTCTTEIFIASIALGKNYFLVNLTLNFSSHNQVSSVKVCFSAHFNSGLAEVLEKVSLYFCLFILLAGKALILPKFSEVELSKLNPTYSSWTIHKHNRKAQHTHSDGQNCLVFILLSYFCWPNSACVYTRAERIWYSPTAPVQFWTTNKEIPVAVPDLVQRTNSLGTKKWVFSHARLGGALPSTVLSLKGHHPIFLFFFQVRL